MNTTLACKEVVGQRLGAGGAVAGPFGDELMCAHLVGDSWRWRHDEIKLCIVNMCNESKVRAEAEVFGQFRDLLPPHLFEQGGGSPVRLPEGRLDSRSLAWNPNS